MQNRTFDPGGSQGRRRACPILGSWRALLRLCVWEWPVMRLQRFSEEIRWLFEARPALNMLCQNQSHAVNGGSRLLEE